MTNYLLDFYHKYPQSTAQDYVKLLYQAEFGCEHIMGDFVLGYIESELPQSDNLDTTLIEPISDEYCRVHLSEYKRKGYSAATIAHCMKAVKSNGSIEHLQQMLGEFVSLVEQGAIPLSLSETNNFVTEYTEAGCPPVHHSQVFRDKYHPHYRVVYRKHAILLPLISAIYDVQNTQKSNMGKDFCVSSDNDFPHIASKPLLVAIDGCCGSGKSYYAELLSDLLGAAVIHCDDFFLAANMRTDARLAEVGGNIHYERLKEVLQRVKLGRPFVYQAYNCKRNDFDDKNFAPTPVVIVEGSYALHQTLYSFYDVKTVLQVDMQTQYARLVSREGETGAVNFVNRWIPLENRYLSTLDKSDCLIIDTGKQ